VDDSIDRRWTKVNGAILKVQIRATWIQRGNQRLEMVRVWCNRWRGGEVARW